jgi:uncharacterized protein YecE (DUF72 family)
MSEGANTSSTGNAMHRVHPYIGCAGWSVPPAHAAAFATIGSHLERYGARFRAVEINSSFYRPHRPATYARWAATVPEDFRFAVKIPKQITHAQRLRDVDVQLERFLNDVVALGPKLGPLLVQLPPSMAFDPAPVDTFFRLLREQFSGDIVCEPRHLSWFSAEVDALLAARRVSRVAADPALVPRASVPGGWHGIVYYRLHGSPRMYYSAYDIEYIEQLAQTLASVGPDVSVWCIFDNTAAGAATQDSLVLQQKLAIELNRTRQPQTPDEI